MTGKKDVERAVASGLRMKQAYDKMYAVMKEQRAALLFLIDQLVSIHDAKSETQHDMLVEIWVPKARETLAFMKKQVEAERKLK